MRISDCGTTPEQTLAEFVLLAGAFVKLIFPFIKAFRFHLTSLSRRQQEESRINFQLPAELSPRKHDQALRALLPLGELAFALAINCTLLYYLRPTMCASAVYAEFRAIEPRWT